MQQKNNVRFLKKITVLSVIMNIIITISAIVLCFIVGEITAGHLSVLLGAWSIELTLSAFIKNSEVKQESQQKEITTFSMDLNSSI